MSEQQYEPGAVGAYTLTSGTTNFVIRTGESCNLKCPYSGEHWHGHIGAVSGDTVEIRRVLVIDPEDPDGMQALYDAIRKRQDVMPLTLEQVTTAVHDLLAPPPEEPMGLGAVVESFEGSVWVRGHHNTTSPWVRSGFGDHRMWDYIPTPLTVLHEGYTLEAK